MRSKKTHALDPGFVADIVMLTSLVSEVIDLLQMGEELTEFQIERLEKANSAMDEWL